ncbi:MAG: fumarylacetoacetate hydrolase family protein [Acidimicrobiales bacterium]
MGFRLANIDGRAALVHGDYYTDLATHAGGAVGPDLMEALERPDLLAELSGRLDDAAATGLLADVTLGRRSPAPKGLRDRTQLRLPCGGERHRGPRWPVVFTKFPSCLTGPNADVEIRSDGCDYEVELVVVIGTGGRDIAPEDAWDHVVGVTVGQDISDRPAQFAAKPPHFDLAKSFDTFGPIGPFVVSTDQLVDRDALHLTCAINGEIRQDGSTSDLIFDVPTLISFLSSITTLCTGDLIFTGTPDGVGAAQGKFLADGDVITTTIDGIGTMANHVVRISDARAIGQ